MSHRPDGEAATRYRDHGLHDMEFRAIVTAYVVCLIVGQLVKPQFSGTPITAVDLLIVASFPLILLRFRAKPGALVAIAAFVTPNFLFGLNYVASGQISSTEFLMGLYALYRFLFPFLLIFSFARRISERDRSFCLTVLMCGLGFHVVFGIIQAAFIPNFAVKYGPSEVHWDVQQHRLVSTFLDPNLASSLFYAALMGFLCNLARKNGTAKPGMVILMTGATVAAALTASRGGALGFAMIFMVLILEAPALNIRRKVKWVAVSSLVVVMALIVFISFFGISFIQRSNRFGASNWSVEERLINLAILATTFLAHPLFGEGFNFLPYLPSTDFVSVTGNYADGGLLYLLGSSGVVGLVSTVAMLYFAARHLMNRRLLVYPAAMLVVQSTSTSSMFYPLLTLFVTFLALSLDTKQNVGVLATSLGKASSEFPRDVAAGLTGGPDVIA